MRTILIAIYATSFLLGACVRPVPAQTDSPRAALEIYLTGLKTGNGDLVRSVYSFGDRRPDFYLPGPIPIESHRITKEKVLDAAGAKRWNDQGIVPSAMVGDVQLDVEERISGRVHMFSYSLRQIDGKWRIYAHSAWDAPD